MSAGRLVRGRKWVVLLLVGFAAATLPRYALAQALADKVPGDAVVYVGWQGADELRAPYGQSRLKAVLDATDAGQLLDTFLPRLMQKAGGIDKDVAEAANLFGSLAKPMWTRPTAFFFAGVDWEAQAPKAALLCRAGDDAGRIKGQLDRLLMDAPPDVKRQVNVTRDGDLLVVSVGYPDGKAAAADKSQSLAGAAAFTAALAHVGKAPAAVGYLDFEKLNEQLDAVVKLSGDETAKQMVPRVREATGLAGLNRVVWTSGFDGRDWSDQLFVAAPGPRKGLLSLLDHGAVSDDALRVIPQSATLAGAAKFDPAKLVPMLRDVIHGIDPDAAAQVDEGLKQVNGGLGIDVQRDLLEAVGDEWAYYSDPMTGGRGLLGAVFVNRLRDPAKAGATLAKLETFVQAQLAEQMKGEEVRVQFFTTKAGDLTIHYAGTPLVTPSWAIQNGNLYVGLYPQVVASAAGHVAGKGKSILDNPAFAALRQRLGGKPAGAVSFLDLPRTAPDAYGQWLAISRLSGFADLFGVQSPPMLIPPLGKLLPELAPAGSMTWADADGWHAKAVSPFPGATVLTSDPLGSVGALQPLLVGAAAPKMASPKSAAAVPERP